ncbi:MAG: hypothetical protein ABIJ43_05700 [Candidatus Beckwithbacteria bacterium]|nr:hypothetical protein [Patescibacteria group bacterium]
MAKHQVKLSLWLIISVAVVVGLMFWRSNPPQPQPVPIKVITEASSSPEPTLFANSSDGEITLEMNQTKGADTITWTLTVSKAQEAAKKIWWQTLPKDTTMSIPFNTVSPDNKYLFLKKVGPDKTRYLVLTVSGEPMISETQTVEFAELFESKYPDYKITEVTGWGGINLIVFNTDKVEGGIGPSFWFDVLTGAFIRLSNRFE